MSYSNTSYLKASRWREIKFLSWTDIPMIISKDIPAELAVAQKLR